MLLDEGTFGNRTMMTPLHKAKILHVALSLALIVMAECIVTPASAQAQTWPSRPIRLIVPFAAGGANDIVARLIQPDLERALGQPVIIENKPAASGTVGTDQVAKATPDGYSLLMAFTTHTVNPAVNAKLPYDTERDLAPIALTTLPTIMPPQPPHESPPSRLIVGNSAMLLLLPLTETVGPPGLTLIAGLFP